MGREMEKLLKMHGIKHENGYVSVLDFTKLLNKLGIDVSRQTVYNLVKDGIIPSEFVRVKRKVKKNYYLIHASALSAILELILEKNDIEPKDISSILANAKLKR